MKMIIQVINTILILSCMKCSVWNGKVGRKIMVLRWDAIRVVIKHCRWSMVNWIWSGRNSCALVETAFGKSFLKPKSEENVCEFSVLCFITIRTIYYSTLCLWRVNGPGLRWPLKPRFRPNWVFIISGTVTQLLCIYNYILTVTTILCVVIIMLLLLRLSELSKLGNSFMSLKH